MLEKNVKGEVVEEERVKVSHLDVHVYMTTENWVDWFDEALTVADEFWILEGWQHTLCQAMVGVLEWHNEAGEFAYWPAFCPTCSKMLMSDEVKPLFSLPDRGDETFVEPGEKDG